MSGYCPDCGNTLCLCSEIEKQCRKNFEINFRCLRCKDKDTRIKELEHALEMECLRTNGLSPILEKVRRP